MSENQTSSRDHTVSINLTLPGFMHFAARNMSKWSTRRKLITLTIVTSTLIIAALLATDTARLPDSTVQAAPPQLANVTGNLTKGTPDFNTILPAGRTIAEYGGWTRVSPPDRNPVYAYIDHIGNIPITVSEQPLPKNFADQPVEQLKVLAQGYHADHTVKAGGTVVYVGTSAKGPQSIIFTKKNLLILIKASASVQEDALKAYVQSLQ